MPFLLREDADPDRDIEATGWSILARAAARSRNGIPAGNTCKRVALIRLSGAMAGRLSVVDR